MQTCEILVLQYSPGHYEYTGKRIDEFGVTGLKLYLNENMICNLPKQLCHDSVLGRTDATAVMNCHMPCSYRLESVGVGLYDGRSQLKAKRFDK